MKTYILRRVHPTHEKGKAVVYANSASEAIRIAEVETGLDWVVIRVVDGTQSEMLLYNIE